MPDVVKLFLLVPAEVCKWVPASILGSNLEMDKHPVQAGVEIHVLLPGKLLQKCNAAETGILSLALLSIYNLLAPMQTLPYLTYWQ